MEFAVESHSKDERQEDDNLEIGLHNHEVEDLVKEAKETDDDWGNFKSRRFRFPSSFCYKFT